MQVYAESHPAEQKDLQDDHDEKQHGVFYGSLHRIGCLCAVKFTVFLPYSSSPDRKRTARNECRCRRVPAMRTFGSGERTKAACDFPGALPFRRVSVAGDAGRPVVSGRSASGECSSPEAGADGRFPLAFLSRLPDRSRSERARPAENRTFRCPSGAVPNGTARSFGVSASGGDDPDRRLLPRSPAASSDRP